MSALITVHPPSGPYRFTVQQYHRMIADGILTDEDPVELLEGELVFKMPKNERHIASVRRCRRAIEAVLPDAYFYDVQDPVTLSDGEPEPDGVVVRGTIEDYDTVKPQPKDVELVIEVSDTSLSRDRGVKLRSYARAGIVCYWIVNLIDRQIEVYTQPDKSSEPPVYLVSEIFKAGTSLPFKLGDGIVGMVPVADVLPAV